MNIQNQDHVPSDPQEGTEGGEQQLSKKQERRLRRIEERETQAAERGRKKTMKKVVLWTIVVLVVGGAAYGMVLLAKRTPTDNGQTGSVLSITQNDWVKGNRDASVTLIEYSDFQCPACGSYYPILKGLTDNFGGEIGFVYRHFPLRQHANAQIAGQAAEAAGNQGAFFEMHDLLFENQNVWSDKSKSKAKETFTSYAQELGLDTEQFNSDMDSEDTEEKVKDSFQSGVRAGVNSTPSFFLNGQKIRNPRNLEEFSALIQEALLESVDESDTIE